MESSSDKRRVMLVAEGWDGSRGGVQRYLRGLMGHLENWEVAVVAPKGGVELDGVEVLRRRFLWPFMKPAWLPLWLNVKKMIMARDPEVVLGGKALFEGLLLQKLQRPYGLFTYAMEIETWLEQGKEKRLKKVLEGAAVVFYMNEKTKGRLLDLGVAEERLTYLPPAVDDYFLQEAVNWKAQLDGLSVQRPYILTAGRLVKRKGFDLVLEAFAKLDQTSWPDLQLVVVGEGPERERLEQMAQQLFLNDRENAGGVQFLGGVSDEQLRALHAGAEFFVSAPRELPGDMEGFGIVFLEAAAQGRASVATRSGGVVEAVEDKKTGLLVEPDDAVALAKAIEKLLTDRQLAEQLGRVGRERVISRFTWPKAGSVLESALNKAGGYNA